MIEVQERQVTFHPPEGAAYLIGDFTNWDQDPLPITGPLTIEFPRGAYVEYAFLDADKQPFADPANPVKPRHPWHAYDRAVTLPAHAFQTPARAHTFRGHLYDHSIYSRAFRSRRHYHVYQPVSPPVATLYIQDGEEYYRALRVHEVVEALVERGEIHPVRLVLIAPHEREKEYWFSERYEGFLLREVIPQVDRHYGPTAERGLWGASLGGLISAWLAWRHPEIFNKVGSQSGCFTADPHGGDSYHDPEWLTMKFASSEALPLRFYLDTGQIEWLLAPNRRFAAMLVDKGYPHCYEERPGGHNWTMWEQGLEPGLKYLFEQKEKPSLSANLTVVLPG